MDRQLAIAILPGILAMAAVFRLLGDALGPRQGYLAALAVYWLLLSAALLWRRGGDWSLRPRWPGLAVMLALVGTVAALWLAGARHGAQLPLPMTALLVGAAVVNGTLEEAFWRGALVPRPFPVAWVTACLLFMLWHLAPLAAQRMDIPGGGAAMVIGAGMLGGLFMAARLTSGTAGASALAHIAVNIPAFWTLAALNAPA